MNQNTESLEKPYNADKNELEDFGMGGKGGGGGKIFTSTLSKGGL